jgi:hypothetical protein
MLFRNPLITHPQNLLCLSPHSEKINDRKCQHARREFHARSAAGPTATKGTVTRTGTREMPAGTGATLRLRQYRMGTLSGGLTYSQAVGRKIAAECASRVSSFGISELIDQKSLRKPRGECGPPRRAALQARTGTSEQIESTEDYSPAN